MLRFSTFYRSRPEGYDLFPRPGKRQRLLSVSDRNKGHSFGEMNRTEQ